MSHNDFVEHVRKRAGLASNEEAERVAAAVLETLGERVYRTEREDMGAQLPKELRQYLFKRLDTEPFELEEFYNRVSSRASVGYPAAVELSRIVMGVLKKAVSVGELEDVLSQLPDSFRELFGKEPEGPLSPTIVPETISRESSKEHGPYQYGTTGMEQPISILDSIKQENKRIMRALNRLDDSTAGNPEERKVIFEVALSRIESQIRIEENHLYPILLVAKETREEIVRSQQECRDIRSLIAEMRKVPKDEPRFQHYAEMLFSMVERHIEREERDLFKKAAEVIPEEQLKMLGEQAERDRGEWERKAA